MTRWVVWWMMLSVATLFARPIQLKTSSGTLYGTLEVPSNTPCPVVLIIAGSGPTDRNGNSPTLAGPNNHLKLLAQALRKNHIASLRYDKRGIGKSRAAGPQEADLRFDDYVQDAVQWCKKLNRDPRFNKLIVMGHSEGSLIGILASQEISVDAFISVAGVGRRASTLIIDQIRNKVPDTTLQKSKQIIDSLLAKQTVADVPSDMNILFRPSVQPYLISWFQYKPTKEIAKLEVPTLIVQGTTDMQVPIHDAKLLSRAKPDARLKMIPGMNHILKSVDRDQKAQFDSYSNPDLPVNSQLIDCLADFVRDLETHTAQ